MDREPAHDDEFSTSDQLTPEEQDALEQMERQSIEAVRARVNSRQFSAGLRRSI